MSDDQKQMPTTSDAQGETNGAAEIHARAKRGIQLLMGRQVLVQMITLGGGVVLARKLTPAQFGLYSIATFLVYTFAHFSDFGLMPSYIQRHSELTPRDIRVGFTAQLALTTAAVAVLLLAAPWLAALYPKAPPETKWLVRVLALDLFLTAWRSIGALQLERQLSYGRLAQVEVLEMLCYQAIAVGLALLGCGVWSFVAATLARSLLGTALIQSAAPCRPGLEMDLGVLREILRYGIPFQLQLLANQATSWITPLFVGALIGPQAVGLLTWASSIGSKPMLLVDNVTRVAFPHFSRVQNDRTCVEKTLTHYLNGLLLITGLWFSIVAVSGPFFVRWIYTDKWFPAVPALTLTAASLAVDTIGWMTAVCLNALGLVRFTTRIVVLRGVAHVALSIPLVLLIGFNGVPIGYLLAAAVTVPWILGGLGWSCASRVLRSIAWLILPPVISTGCGILIARVTAVSLLHAFTALGVVVAVYACIALLAAPPSFTRALRSELSQIKNWGTVGVHPA